MSSPHAQFRRTLVWLSISPSSRHFALILLFIPPDCSPCFPDAWWKDDFKWDFWILFAYCGRSIITQWVRRGYGLKPCGWHNFLAMSTFCELVFVRDSGKILVCKSLKAKDSNSGTKTLLWENRGNISFLWLGGGAGVRQADMRQVARQI